MKKLLNRVMVGLVLFMGLCVQVAHADLVGLEYSDPSGAAKSDVPSQRYVNPAGELKAIVSAGLQRKANLQVINKSGVFVFDSTSSVIGSSDTVTFGGQTYYGAPFTIPSLDEGYYTFRARILDSLNKEVASVDYAITLDRTAPTYGEFYSNAHGTYEIVGRGDLFKLGMRGASTDSFFWNDLDDSNEIAGVEIEITKADGSVLTKQSMDYLQASKSASIVYIYYGNWQWPMPESNLDEEFTLKALVYDKAGNRATVAKHFQYDNYGGAPAPFGVFDPDSNNVLGPGLNGFVAYAPGMTVKTNPIKLAYKIIKSNWHEYNEGGLSIYNGRGEFHKVGEDTEYVYCWISLPFGYTDANYLRFVDFGRWIAGSISYSLVLADSAPKTPALAGVDFLFSDIGWASGINRRLIPDSSLPVTISRVRIRATPQNYIQKAYMFDKTCNINPGEASCEFVHSITMNSGTRGYIHNGVIIYNEDGSLIGNPRWAETYWDDKNYPVISEYSLDLYNKQIIATAELPECSWFWSSWPTIGSAYLNYGSGNISGSLVNNIGCTYQYKFDLRSIPDGNYDIKAIVKRTNTNKTTELGLGPLTIDNTPPSAIFYTTNGTVLNDGDSIESLDGMYVQLNDAMDSAPVLTDVNFTGGPDSIDFHVGWRETGTRVYRLEYPVLLPTLDIGSKYTITVKAKDASGNTSASSLQFVYASKMVDLSTNTSQTISIPAIGKSLKYTKSLWPLTSKQILFGDSTLTGKYNVYAFYRGTDLGMTVGNVAITPEHKILIAANYDFEASGSKYVFSVSASEVGTGELIIMSDAPSAPVLRVAVISWLPTLTLTNDNNWQITTGYNTTNVYASDSSNHCTLVKDEESARNNLLAAPKCLLRWVEVPNGLGARQIAPIGLTGKIMTKGEYQVAARLIMFDMDGVEHKVATQEATLTVVDPDPISFAFEYLYSYKDLSGSDNLYTYTGTNIVGKAFVTGSKPGLSVTIKTASKSKTAETKASTFNDFVTTNITDLWGTEDITVEAYYTFLSDRVYSETFHFIAVPKSLTVTLNATSGVTTEDIVLKGNAGLYQGGGKYLYDSAACGVWTLQANLNSYAGGKLNQTALGTTETINSDGSFEINVGKLAAGTHRISVTATLKETEDYSLSKSVASMPVTVVVRDGSAIPATLSIRETTSATPFYPIISVVMSDYKRYQDISSITWQTSQNGTDFETVEGMSGVAIRPTITESGKFWYKATLTNRWSNTTAETDSVMVQTFARPVITVTGPNATIVGNPVTLKASVQDGVSANFTWLVMQNMNDTSGTVQSGDSLTFSPESTGNLIVRVTAQEVDAPGTNKASTATTYYIVRVGAPTLQKALISGPRYVETGKSYTYEVTVPGLFPSTYVSNLIVKGNWVLPDGTTAAGETLDYTPKAGENTLKYVTWIEQYPEIIAKAELYFSSWTYKWPEWQVITRIIDNRVPAEVRLQVLTKSSRDLLSLGGETITYDWILPEGVELLEKQSSYAVLQFNTVGTYQPAVTISDTRGNSTTIRTDMIQILASPVLDGTLITTVGDRWNRAPSDVNVRVIVTSLPKKDSFASATYKLDGVTLVENGSSSTQIKVAAAGEHEIAATLKSKNGATADLRTQVTLVTGDNPHCTIKPVGDGVKNLSLIAQCNVSMGYVASYQWRVNGEEMPSKGATITFAVSDLEKGVNEVEVTATTDKGQSGSASWKKS